MMPSSAFVEIEAGHLAGPAGAHLDGVRAGIEHGVDARSTTQDRKLGRVNGEHLTAIDEEGRRTPWRKFPPDMNTVRHRFDGAQRRATIRGQCRRVDEVVIL